MKKLDKLISNASSQMTATHSNQEDRSMRTQDNLQIKTPIRKIDSMNNTRLEASGVAKQVVSILANKNTSVKKKNKVVRFD